jgi:hypothetical protein
MACNLPRSTSWRFTILGVWFFPDVDSAAQVDVTASLGELSKSKFGKDTD